MLVLNNLFLGLMPVQKVRTISGRNTLDPHGTAFWTGKPSVRHSRLDPHGTAFWTGKPSVRHFCLERESRKGSSAKRANLLKHIVTKHYQLVIPALNTKCPVGISLWLGSSHGKSRKEL